MPVTDVTHDLDALTLTLTADSAESLQKVLDMGVVEGSTAAINQIDALLAS